MGPLVLIAVGGNALIRAGVPVSAQEQFQNAVDTAAVVVRLIRAGYRVVLTHGNGPQVGATLVRSELAAAHAYRMPLDCCVASTQGEIGYVLQYALWQALQAEGLSTPVVSLVTQVLVHKDDPAFARPTKPIGPFYTRDEAARYRDIFNWDIVELEAIRACVDRGLVVIAAGGGGVPVFNDHDITKGVEAVIDKDHTSAILAAQLGADLFAIDTDEEMVCLDYRRPSERKLPRLTVAECTRYLAEGQFPEGSMGPKIRAAMVFLARGGPEAVITNSTHLMDALSGRGGTHIIR